MALFVDYEVIIQQRKVGHSLSAGQIGHPRGHLFFGGCPGVLITLFLPCPALYKRFNHSFFQSPALFHHTHFSSDPGAATGGMGAEQFDRRIISCKFFTIGNSTGVNYTDDSMAPERKLSATESVIILAAFIPGILMVYICVQGIMSTFNRLTQLKFSRTTTGS